MHRLMLGSALAAIVSLAAPEAQTEPDHTHDAWHALTTRDVHEAYQFLVDNHPATTPAAGDPLFVRRLEAAKNTALARAEHVDNLAGYVATLAEFGSTLDDGHLLPRFAWQPTQIRWTGFIVHFAGDEWTIQNADRDTSGARFRTARLLSCDGQSIPQIVATVLSFHGGVTSGARLSRNAPWLLADDGNPFLRHLNNCRVKIGQRVQDLGLQWRTIETSTFEHMYLSGDVGAAGSGVERVDGGGLWVGLGSLTPAAQTTIERVGRALRKGRQLPFIVIDLRGDDGGDEAYGGALARVIFDALGPQEAMKLEETDRACPTVFRASQDNQAALSRAVVKLRATGDTAGAEAIEQARSEIATSTIRGDELTGAPRCVLPIPAREPSWRRRKKPVVFILTDGACFSSCVGTVATFLRRGAIQIGAATDWNTRYSNLRLRPLPSGLAAFPTLMSIDTSASQRVGPFVPTVEFSGRISDTSAVKQWFIRFVWPRYSGIGKSKVGASRAHVS